MGFRKKIENYVKQLIGISEEVKRNILNDSVDVWIADIF